MKVGDIVIRMLAFEIPQQLKITKIDDKFIHCGPWKFDKITELEVDEDLTTVASCLKTSPHYNPVKTK